MIVAFLVACEIGFWVLVLAGLFFRYILRMPRTGAVLLYCTPLLDLFIIIATVVDLQDGKTATFIHSLSAIYIAISIVFGHRMIRWADLRFAYRFAGGPKPEPQVKPKYGKEHASYERSTWTRYFIAYLIGSAVLLGMIYFINDAERTNALLSTVKIWSIITLVDFLYSFSFTLWPRQAKSESTPHS
ncbi:hypothetical protein [Paenibacillus sp. NPDC058071]|uniref:hypothetical protein n=1 Tax=Paenibacillus sp. NPDC058071 TaxID=3346326 RepID=UPI0036D836E0